MKKTLHNRQIRQNQYINQYNAETYAITERVVPEEEEETAYYQERKWKTGYRCTKNSEAWKNEAVQNNAVKHKPLSE